MINNLFERERALEDLAYLQAWVDRLEKESPAPQKAMTKAGIRKKKARIFEDLSQFDSTLEVAEKHAS